MYVIFQKYSWPDNSWARSSDHYLPLLRTGSGSGHARTTPAARKRIASAPREADAAEQPRIPTSRVTRRGTAPEAPAGGDREAGDAADEADDEAIAVAVS